MLSLARPPRSKVYLKMRACPRATSLHCVHPPLRFLLPTLTANPADSLSFLRTLFAHRAVFHRIAAGAQPSNAPPSVIVCWVDALLAKLAPVITGECTSANSASDFIQSQRYSDSLRAAAQLPGTIFCSRFVYSDLTICRVLG